MAVPEYWMFYLTYLSSKLPTSPTIQEGGGGAGIPLRDGWACLNNAGNVQNGHYD